MNNLQRAYMERFENLEWLEKHLENESYDRIMEFYKESIFHDMENSAIIAIRAMSKIAKTIKQEDEVADLLNLEIFGHTSLDAVKEYFKNRLKPAIVNIKKERIIMFHLYGWLYGGAERVLSQLINGLSGEYNTLLAVFPPVENSTFLGKEQSDFMIIQGDKNKIKRLYKLIVYLKLDIFIGNNNSIPELLPIYEWLENTPTKTIAYSHEYYFFPHRNDVLCDITVAKNYYLGKANAAVFLTSFSTQAYTLINDNGATIPNPAPFIYEEFHPCREKTKKILAVGRFFDYIKRVDLILEVYAEILKSEPEVELTIVGPYNFDLFLPDKQCTVKELLQHLHLDSKRINFVGNQKDMSKWYKENDILIMTSDNEGFAMVLVEAGAFGLPCVIFDIPGLEDIIIDGENGYIVSRDVTQMAKKVIMLLEDDSLRERMSLAARKNVYKFQIENVGKKWKQLLDALLKYDNEAEINRFLQTNFQKEITDINVFSKRVIAEYENNLSKIINSDKYK